MKSFSILFCSCLIAVALHAQIIHVPSDYPTIQQGIDASASGDTILISPGTYMENIYISGLDITIASFYAVTQDTSYISQTIIDGNQSGSVVYVNMAYSTAILIGLTLINGQADQGGGVYCNSSFLILEHTILNDNTASNGGGIYCNWGYIQLDNLNITGNSASYGGAIYLGSNCYVLMASVKITANSASQGGGIYVSNYGNSIIFDSLNRCNIYMNAAGVGNDMYSETFLNVILDTFSVANPTQFHAAPISNYSFDILNGLYCQVNADLYVSPAGDNNNSGLTASESLKTIHCAFSRILADSLNQHTINLLYGFYSHSSTSEKFPLSIPDYITLVGESEEMVIIDAEYSSSVIYINNNSFNHISFMTLTGGRGEGGIYCKNSNPLLEYLTVKDNDCMGISCDNSSPILQYSEIFNNNGSGISCDNSSPILQYSEIFNNKGSGIYCSNSSPELSNVIIFNNSANHGGGICSGSNCQPILKNVKITGNSASQGGGIFASNSNIIFDSLNRCNIYMNAAGEGNDMYSETFLHVILDTFSVANPTEFHAAPVSNFSFDILNGLYSQVNADLYVSPAGDNNNSGLTASEPLKTIHCAFTKILVNSQEQHKIYLSDGIYSPSSTNEIFPLGIPDYICLEGSGDSLVILDAENKASVIWIKDNYYNRISGMTLTGGSGSYGYAGRGSQSCGGGIYSLNSNLWLNDIIICHNGAEEGGGMACINCSPILENVKFSFNSSSAGGAVFCEGAGYVPVLNNVMITENSAMGWGGGGIMCLSSSPALNDVTFKNNIASYGGGISMINSSSVMKNVTIADNVATNYGGGISIISDHVGTPTLENVTITGNTAVDGGGIYCDRNPNAYLKNVIIANNIANNTGGGICMEIYSNFTLNNVTMSENSAAVGGGIYTYWYNSATLLNMIMWNNTPEEIAGWVGNTVTISFSDIRGGESGIVGTGVVWLEGNVDEDPLFTGNGEDPYALSDGSPCIDTGIPDTTGLHLPSWDIIGNVRVWDGNDDGIVRIDMGAYEYGSVGVGIVSPKIFSRQSTVICYPNPLNDHTTIDYELAEFGKVTLTIYNNLGQEIDMLVDEQQNQGNHHVIWNAEGLPSGIYFYRLSIGKQSYTGKMTVVR